MGNCMPGATFVVNGRYLRIQKRLGEGGFSYVELVYETETDSYFALKRISCSDPEELEIAKSEIKSYRQYQHQYLVPIVDSDVISSPIDASAKEACILFPAYQSGSLQDVMDQNRAENTTTSEQQICNWMEKMCRGLSVLHHANPPASHRDLKPANVLLDDNNDPVLIDFGSVTPGEKLVKNRKEAISEQDRAAENSSLPYRAPELVDVPSTCSLTTKTDMWSVGVLLYALAYNETPFERLTATGGSLPLAICQGKVTYPEADTYSKAFHDLIEELLHVEPTARPSVDQTIEKLERLQSAA